MARTKTKVTQLADGRWQATIDHWFGARQTFPPRATEAEAKADAQAGVTR
jgi:hypothetical protein